MINPAKVSTPMTRAEILSSDAELLTAVQVSGVLGANPATIRMAAHERPDILGFPVFVLGKMVKIPRIPFCQSMGWIGQKEIPLE